jgi:hypothetical protein
MSNRSFRAPNGFSSTSATGRALDRAELYGSPLGYGELDDRPVPEDEKLETLVDTMFDAVTNAFNDSGLEEELDYMLSSLTYACHHQVERLQRLISDAENHIRQANEEDDMSEVSTTQLERLKQNSAVLEDRRDAFEQLRDFAKNAYSDRTGKVWSIRKGSIANHRNMTASSIEAQQYLSNKKYRETHTLAPKGTLIAFSGGYDCQDVNGIWADLDKARAKYPDMVLIHTAGAKGADAIAVAWAHNRGVTEIPYPMRKRNADDRAAPFRRNDELLALWPKGVIVYPGSGITANLADKAKQNGITVLDRRPPEQKPGA